PGSGTWSAWNDADVFSLNSKEDATAFGFTADAGGNHYACGFANNKGWPQWIVRRKLASGGGWSTIANFQLQRASHGLLRVLFPRESNPQSPARVVRNRYPQQLLDGPPPRTQRCLDYR